MLIKAINLNLKIAHNYITATAFLLISSIFMGGVVIAVAVIIALRGYCRLFCSSVYLDEASLYMTLPISPAINMWGKILACVVWNLLLGGIALIALIVVSLFMNDGDIFALIEPLIRNLLDFGMSPLQGAIHIGLIPLSVVISTCGTCFFILTVQEIVGKKGKNKNRGYVVVLAVVLFGILTAILKLAVDKLVETVNGLDYFYGQLMLFVLYLFLTVTMYNFCKNTWIETTTLYKGGVRGEGK